MNRPISLIIDTDVGDDIDDALALGLALRCPELNLIGVTTVFRDAPRRALLAREVLDTFGGDGVPVYAGCSEPILPDWDNFPEGRQVGRQFEALDPALTWQESRHAVDFLIRTARQFGARGEKLTIVCIGAMTNMALALRLAPDIIPHVEVRAMGALWGREEAEWNILCDPEAAELVLRSGVALTLVSFDVTEQVILSDEQNSRFSASSDAGARFLGALIRLWGHRVFLHDPLTVLTLFSDVVSFAPMRLEVCLPAEGRAVTRRIEGQTNARVAVAVEVEAAKELFLARVLPSA